MNIPFTISGLRKIGLTQAQIGSEIGLKQPSISDMESGKAGVINPSSRVEKGLAALAAKYGVPTEFDANAPDSTTTLSSRKPVKKSA